MATSTIGACSALCYICVVTFGWRRACLRSKQCWTGSCSALSTRVFCALAFAAVCLTSSTVPALQCTTLLCASLVWARCDPRYVHNLSFSTCTAQRRMLQLCDLFSVYSLICAAPSCSTLLLNRQLRCELMSLPRLRCHARAPEVRKGDHALGPASCQVVLTNFHRYGPMAKRAKQILFITPPAEIMHFVQAYL